MSGLLGILNTSRAVATTFAIPALSASGLIPAWIRQGRSIGTIIPDVTIEESHSDRVQITQHPVAYGTPIADHAFRLPVQVTMKCGWSNANLPGTLVSAFMSGTNPFGGFTETRAKEIYATLRALQGDEGKPIDVISITTGKRKYDDMILTELSVRTDHTTEYALMIEAQFTQVIRVRTRSTTQPAVSNLVDKERTAPTTDTPGKQVDPKPDTRSPAKQLKDMGIPLPWSKTG